MSEPKSLEEQVEDAISHLYHTDTKHAKAKSLLHALQEQRKTVKAIAYMEAIGKGKTQGVAEQVAYSSEKYQDHLKKMEEAEYDFQILQNTRKRAELTVELYRTRSANMRRGNI